MGGPRRLSTRTSSVSTPLGDRDDDSDGDGDQSGDEDRRRRCMARASRVFNIAQVDVLAKSFYACVPEPAAEALPAALASAKLRHARFQRAVKKDAQGIE